MLKRGHKLAALLRVVTQPVQQLGKSPLVGVHPPAPLDPLKTHRVSLGGNLLGLGKGAMVAPQVILIQRLQPLAHRNHARAGRVERNGRNRAPIHPRSAQRVPRRGRQGCHLVGVGLCGKIRVFAAAVKGIRGRCGSDWAFQAVHKSDANAECAKINTGDNGHGRALQ